MIRDWCFAKSTVGFSGSRNQLEIARVPNCVHYVNNVLSRNPKEGRGPGGGGGGQSGHSFGVANIVRRRALPVFTPCTPRNDRFTISHDHSCPKHGVLDNVGAIHRDTCGIC